MIMMVNNKSYYNVTNNLNSSSGYTIIEDGSFVLSFSILLIIVMFIGVIGNLLVIYVVLNYGRLKTVTNTYLLHLALSDLVFLSGIPFFVSSLVTRSWIFGGFVCKLFFLTQGVNQYTSIIILALLAFDRYLAVCHSAQSIIWRSRVNPNLLLILTWILSFILMLPIIIFTTTQVTSAPNVQCTIILPLSESRVLYLVFVAYTSTITFLLPLILMMYFYVKIVRRLQHKVSQQHRRSRTSLRTRRKVSVLVLAVIGVHIFCCSPYWAFQVFTTSELLPQTSPFLVPTSSVAQFLLFVNSSTNPILYAFLSEIFRLSFKRVFSCCTSNNDKQYILEKKPSIKRIDHPEIPTGDGNYLMVHKQKTTRSNAKHTSTATASIDNGISMPMKRNRNQQASDTTKETNLNLDNQQCRHLSLAPTVSVFSLEASSASDI